MLKPKVFQSFEAQSNRYCGALFGMFKGHASKLNDTKVKRLDVMPK